MSLQAMIGRCLKFEDVEMAKKILAENPGDKVNEADRQTGDTALHLTCCDLTEVSERIASLLLAHPGINVNAKDNLGYTPFIVACIYSNIPLVRLLLRDRRVKVNEPNPRKTPLKIAAYDGSLEVIKWWIASGREMELGQTGNENDAIEAARKNNNLHIVILLERFRDNPTQTRSEVRQELGWFGMEAEVFALVVFLCDGLFDLKTQAPSNASRFFAIARQLPLELQMVLCHRLAGSCGDNIPFHESEAGFKGLSALVA